MRRARRGLAVAGVVAAATLPTPAMADGCVGLQCQPAGQQGLVVPEGGGGHTADPGPRALWRRGAGFYEYDDPAGSGRIVAYLTRPEELHRIPGSVAALPVVRDLRASGQLGQSPVVVLGPEMASIASPDDAAGSAKAPRRERAARTGPRAVGADYNQCSAGYFCVWASAGYYGWVSWFGQTDWVNLSSTGMGANNIEARRNWRSTDALLADENGGMASVSATTATPPPRASARSTIVRTRSS